MVTVRITKDDRFLSTKPDKDFEVTFEGFKKRDGSVVEFNPEKILNAVRKAAAEVQEGYPQLFASKEQDFLKIFYSRLIGVELADVFTPGEMGALAVKLEDVQNAVEGTLGEFGWDTLKKAYSDYRIARDLTRNKISVRKKKNKLRASDITDDSLLLVSNENFEGERWNRAGIVEDLIRELELPKEEAELVAKLAENRVFALNMSSVEASLVREIVNSVLRERGHAKGLKDASVYRVSNEFILNSMGQKGVENSNIVSNTPEAVSMSIAGLVLKKWALDNVFSPDVAEAHQSAAVHLHDLDFPHRNYCSSHSIAYIAKYGLVGLHNLATESAPANSASVLIGHLNTFIASMQANFAGAMGLAYVNVFFAPYLRKEAWPVSYLQRAQELIFNLSQCAYSRGSQTVFSDFNIHAGVPDFLKQVPAIGPGGKYRALDLTSGQEIICQEIELDEKDSHNRALRAWKVDNLIIYKEVFTKAGYAYDAKIAENAKIAGYKILTYGDYELEAQQFAKALLEVWQRGDKHGNIFPFPKCDFHIDHNTWEDPAQHSVFEKACELSAANGSTYFIFDHDSVTLSACCRLRTTLDDNRMLFRPESLSFVGFQNITINIPQAAYRSKRKIPNLLEYSIDTLQTSELWEKFLHELDLTMSVAVKAHLQKKEFVTSIMFEPGQPLYQTGSKTVLGEPYVNLEKATYIIGLIGLDDALAFLTGKRMHEDERVFKLGLAVIAHMYSKAAHYSTKHGLKFSLEESPAESAARRLAKTDLALFPESASVVQGDPEHKFAYYTNSIHFSASAPISLLDRIIGQSKFHPLIQSGAIIHAFVGEQKPDKESIEKLVKQIYENTQCAQVTISPEFSFCSECKARTRGLIDKCKVCGSEKIEQMTRIVGYFSRIANWNVSKRFGELKDRHAGDYNV